MTYEEAEELSYKTLWKIGICHTGEQCWCRTILPVEPINYIEINTDFEQEYYIIGDASVNKELAEYIVKLHNERLERTIQKL